MSDTQVELEAAVLTAEDVNARFEKGEIDIAEFGRLMADINRQKLIAKGEYFAVGMPVTVIVKGPAGFKDMESDAKITGYYPEEDDTDLDWLVTFSDGSWTMVRTSELRWR